MKNKVTKEDVENFIKELEVEKFGEKTTIVKAVLQNGFVLVEHSSCVDPVNFDMELGKKICMERIESKIFELLGFKLQCTLSGIEMTRKEFAKIVLEQAVNLQEFKDFEDVKDSIAFMNKFISIFNDNVIQDGEIDEEKLTPMLENLIKEYIK